MTTRLAPLETAFPKRERPLLMTALVVGDPYLQATRSYMDIVVDAGADLIELVLPFSDPAYHGPVMRRACARAMGEKVDWTDLGEIISDFRANNDETPIIVSSYYNRVLARGHRDCVQGLKEAGADAIMVTDLPFDEARDLREELEAQDMALIQTVAATTGVKRFRRISCDARGIIVWTGHSGAEVMLDLDSFEVQMQELRQFTSLPLVASMHVESGRDALLVGRSSEGVLVGSSLAWLIEGGGPKVEERLHKFVKELRVNLDAAPES